MKTQKDNSNSTQEVKSHAFSMEHLNRIGNNDAAFNLLMLKKFSDSIIDNMQGLEEGLLNNNWVRIRNAVHKSIPSYHMMGLEKLVDCMQSIQAKIDKSEYNKEDVRLVIQNEIDFLQKENKNILLELTNYIKQLENNS